MHLIDGTEPGQAGVQALVDRALALRAGAEPRRRAGARVAAMFLNPSLRTRTSLEAACGLLGAQPIILSPGRDSWALELEDRVMDGAEAEHVREAAAVLSEYAHLLAVRAFAGLEDAEEDRQDRVVRSFAAHASVPVVNLESACWHPLQGLADTATWVSHFGPDLRGRRLCLTWAPHPRALPAAVPNQVLLSAALQGMEITVAHPEGFDLDPEVVSRARGLARDSGGDVTIQHHQDLRGAQVVVAKSWSGFSGYGRRGAEAEARAGLQHWRVAASTVPSHAGFMHCLPVRRGVVVEPAVLEGPNSWVIEEAGLRLWTAAALLEQLLEDAA
jgi:N-acetylornithine carbamoyltransferase